MFVWWLLLLAQRVRYAEVDADVVLARTPIGARYVEVDAREILDNMFKHLSKVNTTPLNATAPFVDRP